MADVFISYSHKDRERIQKLVDGLKALGLSVWYDARIRTGVSYDEEIRVELTEAKAIMVCWSVHSVASKWVRSEATFGDDQKVLVPCRLEACSPPPPFNINHTEDMSGWAGDPGHAGLRKILERIGELTGRPGLLALHDAKASGDAMRMAIWAKEYPADPVANSAMDTWKTQEEQSFKARLSEVKGDIDAYFRDQQTRAKSRFTKMEKEFGTWVAAGSVANPDKRPNPRQVLTDIIGRAGDEPALRDALSMAEARATDTDAALQRAKAEHAALAAELRDQPVVQKSSPLVLAGVAALCLTGGFFASRAITDPGQMAQQKIDAESVRAREAVLRAEVAEKKVATLESGLAAAQRQAQSLQGDVNSATQKLAVAEAQARDAEQAKMEASRKLDEAVKKSGSFGMTPEPPPPSMTASAPGTSTSISNTTASQNMESCTRGAGSRFDTDNSSKDGPNDTATLTLDVIRATISSCRAASQQAGDTRVKRRAFAQLGRAQAALAVRLGQANMESDAKQAMQIALNSWTTAASLGSAFAMNQIGAYHDGSFSREVNRSDSSYFGPRDQREAITHWSAAAKGGNPPAMTNMAAMMLDLRSTLVNFDAQQADQYLEASMRLGHARAFIVKAAGVLNGHLEPFLRGDANKRQRAAQLAEKAACAGDRAAADAFFTVDFRATMASYKPANYAC